MLLKDFFLFASTFVIVLLSLSLIVAIWFHHRMASISRGQGGIQQLLAAEQEAQQIVNDAKNGIAAVPRCFHFHFLVFWFAI